MKTVAVRADNQESLSRSRREFLQGAAASGFLLAFYLPARAVNEPEQLPDDTAGKFAPNAFIRIDKSGAITLVMPQVEMGQGIYTGVAMILAEELDADPEQVVLEHAPPNEKLYTNPLLGIQATGGSTSLRAFWMPLRTAGATARAMLVQAAALRWHVDPASCTTSRGDVSHAASNRKISYGALIDAASKNVPPKNVPLKDPAKFVLIGTPHKRFDTSNKVNGKVIYGIDAMVPGMKFATFAPSPVLGGKVAEVDDSAAKALPGVRQVIVLDDLVAVVGDHMWAAKKGLQALKISWVPGEHAKLSSADLWQDIRIASQKDGVIAKSLGDVEKGLSKGQRFEADYELPFLAHAPMEPLNCTVLLKEDSCELWIGTQIIARVQQTTAALTGLPVDKVTVHNHLIGGGFGRRLEPDMALTAVRIAQHMKGVPVKVVWTRETDIRQDIVRPMYRNIVSASLADGKVAAWKYKVCGPSIIARWLPPGFQKGIDGDAVDSAVDMPYDIPDFQVQYLRVEPRAVPTGWWRGVGPNINVFAIESFMDELARKAGKDPIAFRRDMLAKQPRLLAALDLVAAKSDWGKPLPARVGRGVCVQPSFGSFIATVVEAEVDAQGEVALRRVTTAVDVGTLVNPDSVEAQLQGGLVFGLTAALYGEITIKNGRIEQSNFNDYRMLRIDQVPRIEVHLIKSGEPPGGVGETGTTAGPPALRNAILAATGVGLRRLPIDRALLTKNAKG
ncbi:MAG TPA: xanthine dehydrogenase family protein molybdopterin-binding subunit [Steroidobacteraceae bacterium]|nr:xanthine dehydrogenase family protein molybdopterin-binding subunit [Steroidobacteraceae bacterium]